MGKFTSKNRIPVFNKMKLFSAFVFAFVAVEAKKVREPDWRVNQLQRKLEDVMDNHYGRWGNWSRRMKNQSRRIADKMINDWEKRAAECKEEEGSGEGSGDWEEENDIERGDRYDAGDPCRAARQLTRNMITWSRQYNVNTDCEGNPIDDADNIHFTRIEKAWTKYEAKMKRKGKCAE